MLVEVETALVDFLRQSPLKDKLRAIDSLPDLAGETLVKRFGTDAPAVYAVLSPVTVADGAAKLRYGLVCVTKNSGSHQKARHGDGVALGLYQLADSVAGLINGARAGDASWQVIGIDPVNSDLLYQSGLYVAVVRIETSGAIELPPPVDEATLAPFETFHVDLDIPPHESSGEHAKWLQEPPDQSQSKSDAEDTITLPQ